MDTLSSPEVHGDDRAQGVRRPISVKIFGIALGLLALMAVVTSLSERNLRKVNNEIEALAEYYIPLSHLISKMEVDVRSQIIHLERLVLLQQFQQVDAAALKQEKSSFEEKGKDVDGEVARRAAGSGGEDLEVGVLVEGDERHVGDRLCAGVPRDGGGAGPRPAGGRGVRPGPARPAGRAGLADPGRPHRRRAAGAGGRRLPVRRPTRPRRRPPGLPRTRRHPLTPTR